MNTFAPGRCGEKAGLMEFSIAEIIANPKWSISPAGLMKLGTYAMKCATKLNECEVYKT